MKVLQKCKMNELKNEKYFMKDFPFHFTCIIHFTKMLRIHIVINVNTLHSTFDEINEITIHFNIEIV